MAAEGVERERGDDGNQRDDRADAEIDAAADDDKGHAQRADADDNRLCDDGFQIVAADKCGRGNQDENNQDERQTEKRSQKVQIYFA